MWTGLSRQPSHKISLVQRLTDAHSQATVSSCDSTTNGSYNVSQHEATVNNSSNNNGSGASNVTTAATTTTATATTALGSANKNYRGLRASTVQIYNGR